MTRRYTKVMLATMFAGVLMTGAPAARADEAVLEAKAIAKMASEAQSGAEHEKVAKHYRLRAESLEAKANKLETEVRKQKAAPPNSMEAKWPAMIVNARERKERVAMQLRRAAQECYTLAERHSDLAAEARAAE